jgi:hypothetical protein
VDVLVDLICAQLFLAAAIVAAAAHSTSTIGSISMCVHSSHPPLNGFDE